MTPYTTFDNNSYSGDITDTKAVMRWVQQIRQ